MKVSCQNGNLDNKLKQTNSSTILIAPSTSNTDTTYLGVNKYGSVFKQINGIDYAIPYFKTARRESNDVLLHYIFNSGERHFIGFFYTEGSDGMNGHNGIISININYSRNNGVINKLTEISYIFTILNVTNDSFDIQIVSSDNNAIHYIALEIYPL